MQFKLFHVYKMHLLVNKEFNIAFAYHTLCALGRSKPGGFFLSIYARKPFWRWKVGLDCPDLDKNREKFNKNIYFSFSPHSAEISEENTKWK